MGQGQFLARTVNSSRCPGRSCQSKLSYPVAVEVERSLLNQRQWYRRALYRIVYKKRGAGKFFLERRKRAGNADEDCRLFHALHCTDDFAAGFHLHELVSERLVLEHLRQGLEHLQVQAVVVGRGGHYEE